MCITRLQSRGIINSSKEMHEIVDRLILKIITTAKDVGINVRDGLFQEIYHSVHAIDPK
jgi:hypothetical protein